MRTLKQLGYEWNEDQRKWLKVNPTQSWESSQGLPEPAHVSISTEIPIEWLPQLEQKGNIHKAVQNAIGLYLGKQAIKKTTPHKKLNPDIVRAAINEFYQDESH